MKKTLKDLSQAEYHTLDKMGFLYELFPEASGSYKNDCASIPKPVTLIQWTDLLKILDGYLASVASGDEEDTDPYFIYEDLMKTVYGEDIIKWLNQHE